MFYAAAYFYLKKDFINYSYLFSGCHQYWTHSLELRRPDSGKKNDACLCKSGPRSKLKVFVKKGKTTGKSTDELTSRFSSL